MPKRRRGQEANRAARRGRPDLRGSDVVVVGRRLQEDEAWQEHEQGDECWKRCQ